jgi:hypothetical protein
MTNHASMLDELRLRYSEEAHQIDILEAKKRTAEEIGLKRARLALLKEIGAEFARLTNQSKERVA